MLVTDPGVAPITSSEELGLLLTLESLLFAALSIVTSLSGESHLGRMLPSGPKLFGAVAALVITVIGFAAFCAIWETYDVTALKEWRLWVTPLGLSSGAVAEVALGWWITLALPGRDG